MQLLLSYFCNFFNHFFILVIITGEFGEECNDRHNNIDSFLNDSFLNSFFFIVRKIVTFQKTIFQLFQFNVINTIAECGFEFAETTKDVDDEFATSQCNTGTLRPANFIIVTPGIPNSAKSATIFLPAVYSTVSSDMSNLHLLMNLPILLI